jgi:hypothetical protein
MAVSLKYMKGRRAGQIVKQPWQKMQALFRAEWAIIPFQA